MTHKVHAIFVGTLCVKSASDPYFPPTNVTVQVSSIQKHVSFEKNMLNYHGRKRFVFSIYSNYCRSKSIILLKDKNQFVKEGVLYPRYIRMEEILFTTIEEYDQNFSVT